MQNNPGDTIKGYFVFSLLVKQTNGKKNQVKQGTTFSDRCDMRKKISAGVIETTEKPGVIQTKKSQVKRKEWEKRNQCDIRQPGPYFTYLVYRSFESWIL